MEEVRYQSTGGRARGSGRARSRAKMKAVAQQRAKDREKEDKKDDEVNESALLTRELLETLEAYKRTVQGLQGRNAELDGKLRNATLWNSKLVYANKLLAKEGLNEKQRRTVIEALDEAKNLDEVKRAYASLSEAISGTNGSQKINESFERKVLGGSSRPSKSGGMTLTEADKKEFARWGDLAGIG
jgi:hypothetical protein